MEIQTVLLVDDEPDIRLIAEMGLSKVGGLTVFTAASGSEALATAVAQSPDVILLDVMMPGMDGPETLEGLRADERTRATPVIFVTAKAQQSEIERFMGLGAAGVVAKPFNPLTLADQVREIAAEL